MLPPKVAPGKKPTASRRKLRIAWNFAGRPGHGDRDRLQHAAEGRQRLGRLAAGVLVFWVENREKRRRHKNTPVFLTLFPEKQKKQSRGPAEKSQKWGGLSLSSFEATPPPTSFWRIFAQGHQTSRGETWRAQGVVSRLVGKWVSFLVEYRISLVALVEPLRKPGIAQPIFQPNQPNTTPMLVSRVF